MAEARQKLSRLCHFWKEKEHITGIFPLFYRFFIILQTFFYDFLVS